MRSAIILAALIFPFAALADNYADCILDRAPGLQNDASAHAAHDLCWSKHPGGLQAVAQGSGRGIFGFDSGAECTLKKAADTRSRIAALSIAYACNRLYDPPKPGLFDDLIPKHR